MMFLCSSTISFEEGEGGLRRLVMLYGVLRGFQKSLFSQHWRKNGIPASSHLSIYGCFVSTWNEPSTRASFVTKSHFANTNTLNISLLLLSTPSNTYLMHKRHPSPYPPYAPMTCGSLRFHRNKKTPNEH